VIEDIKEDCIKQNADDDEIISFYVCDIIETEFKLKLQEVIKDKDVFILNVICEYRSSINMGADLDILETELQWRLKKWIGKNRFRIIDLVNTFPPDLKQW
jgi:hypothetical protein